MFAARFYKKSILVPVNLSEAPLGLFLNIPPEIHRSVAILEPLPASEKNITLNSDNYLWLPHSFFFSANLSFIFHSSPVFLCDFGILFFFFLFSSEIQLLSLL